VDDKEEPALSDFDSPWKEVLDHFFPAFLQFFFADAHQEINWSRGYESLDKELQQIVHEAELGLRLADKLFKVWLKDGQETWVLIHVELQYQRDSAFAERMYIYNYRLYDRHRRRVVSLAVLGDEDFDWRPKHFGFSLFGCTVSIDFPVVKLLDYAANVSQWETDANPFAAVVLAHLKTVQTRQDPANRQVWKFRLIKSLYERGLQGEDIRQLFRVLDWMMDLPAELERQLIHDLTEFEKERKMPYVTSVERIARQEGKAEGKAEALLRVLSKKIHQGQLPEDLQTAIRATLDMDKLDVWIDYALATKTVAEFREQAGI
jgi:hypothetical protein